MRFTEAVKTIRQFSSTDLPIVCVHLVTGFNSLHLQVFLQAHLQQKITANRISVTTDIFGDLTNSLPRIDPTALDMCAIALEWSDLDPRLGFRSLGGWSYKDLPDIIGEVETRLAAIQESLAQFPNHFPIALSLPTLDLPPIFLVPSSQLSEAEVRLRQALNNLALWASSRTNIRLLRQQRYPVDAEAQIFDFKGELMAGLPYTLKHADQLAQTFAQLLIPSLPKKGLITDLDDTLWAGIAGEVGPESVSWNLDSKAQTHGLYQQVLCALADQGVLIGIVSKNNPEVVEAVFRRSDIVLARDRIFPLEASWNSKRKSVAKILQAWNVHADSVVFVDDSPSELAEVKAAYPAIECIQFDGQDYRKTHALLYRLRDLFARHAITEEDTLRRESLQAASVFRETALSSSFSQENFLRDAQAKIVFDFSAGSNPRSLELVNKTNQFNLNGTRYSESEWQQNFAGDGNFVISANYRDKYGPLGVIAVLAGKCDGAGVTLKTWVMSCRAFGRRIEHQCMKIILDRFPGQEIVCEFSATARNEYLQGFLKSFLGQRPTTEFLVPKAVFLNRCPALYHEVEISNG